MALYASRIRGADLSVFTIIAGNIGESVSPNYPSRLVTTDVRDQDALVIQERVENTLHISSLSTYDTAAFILPEGASVVLSSACMVSSNTSCR